MRSGFPCYGGQNITVSHPSLIEGYGSFLLKARSASFYSTPMNRLSSNTASSSFFISAISDKSAPFVWTAVPEQETISIP